MIERNNKTCIVCGKSYKYCSGCAEYTHLEPWHSIYCSDNCKEIFNIVSMYNKVPKEETRSRLNKCDLSNKNTFHKNILKTINELYSLTEEIKAVDTIKTNIETIEDVMEKAELVEDIQKKTIETNDIDVTKEEIENVIEENNVVKTALKNKKRKKDYEVI